MALLFVGALVILVPGTSATVQEIGKQDGTFTGDIVSGEFMAYRMEGLGEKDSLSFFLTVTDDVAEEDYLVDVYLFTVKAFAEYIDNSVRHTFAELKEQRTTVSDFFYQEESPTLVYVIDNTDISSDGSDPEGPVHYNLIIKRVDYLFPWLIWLLLILTILLLMFLITYRVLRKRRYRHGPAGFIGRRRFPTQTSITKRKVTTTTGPGGYKHRKESISRGPIILDEPRR